MSLCTCRCCGCPPMPLGSINSRSGSVGCNANICSPITSSAPRTSNALSTTTSPIITTQPNPSTGPRPSTSLHTNSEHTYDRLYLAFFSYALSIQNTFSLHFFGTPGEEASSAQHWWTTGLKTACLLP